ncbi:LytR/AlgR family response regulator transcription factor [Bacteroides sp. UBA939]|uniref:LytR/AlgR family response regulator transcription factor n=1 Tax=Bacteroides sp. UBA939 TaxID=1946092 RepID=UPI0025B81BCD|nr:LytTR family DNA-binding domain-containing protein [Bacteroides sp. UBA939]
MKVLIIEDERPASQKLKRLLKETDPGIEVVDILGSVEQSVNWFLENRSPELIFMDIQLEDGLCFEIFEKIRIKTPIIFTTAYDRYALNAFKVNCIDYLLKPVNPYELRNAIDKFDAIHRTIQDYSKYESVIHQLPARNKERFLIKIGEHYKSVPTSDISCFYSLERSVFLFTNTGKSYPVDYSLDRIEQLVDSKLFFRVNRNFIVNYYAIQDMIAYSSNRIKIILANWREKEEIIVSRERVSDFLKVWMDR